MKKVVALMVALGLSACVSQSEVRWQPYQALDGSLNQIALQKNPAAKAYEIQGEAKQKGVDGRVRSLGELYLLVDQRLDLMTLILKGNLSGKSYNPYDKQDTIPLAQATTVDFYAFGRGRVGHTQFISSQGVCKAFLSEQGVLMKMVTTYYANKDKTDYFAQVTEAQGFAKKSAQVTAYQPTIYSQSEATTEFLQGLIKKEGKNLSQENLNEAQRVLKHIICR